MRTVLMLCCGIILLAGCGVRRPLMKPSDIPAYEEKQAKKRARLEEDPSIPAAEPAAPASPVPDIRTPASTAPAPAPTPAP